MFLQKRYASPRKKGTNNPLRRKMIVRFIISPIVSLVQEWHVVQHTKFPQKLTKTKKKRMQRLKGMEKRQLNEALKEAPDEKTKESEKLKE